MSETSNKAGGTAEIVREQGAAALRAVVQRKHIIFCVAGALCIAGLLYLLWPLIPRSVKPDHYRVGELSIQSMTQVVGYRKVTGISQSLSGVGRAEAGRYTYRAGADPMADVETYYAALMEQYGAQMLPESEIGPEKGNLLLTMPGTEETSQITLELVYDTEQYTVTVGERTKPAEKKETDYPVNVTEEQARELLLTLTKQDTGFKSDISIYTVELEPDRAQVDGWDYYVFTVLADYSATRIEYRGTFYVGCYDGVVLSYDKETGVTSRLRGPGGVVEEAPSAEPESPEGSEEG